jgi:hypothetical protein
MNAAIVGTFTFQCPAGDALGVIGRRQVQLLLYIIPRLVDFSHCECGKVDTSHFHSIPRASPVGNARATNSTNSKQEKGEKQILIRSRGLKSGKWRF